MMAVGEQDPHRVPGPGQGSTHPLLLLCCTRLDRQTLHFLSRLSWRESNVQCSGAPVEGVFPATASFTEVLSPRTWRGGGGGEGAGGKEVQGPVSLGTESPLRPLPLPLRSH